MFALDLPIFDVKIRKTDSGMEVFDPLRRKYVALTPEEWVRQHFVNYLHTEKHYPASLMANEVSLKLNSMSRRCDTVVYSNKLEPVAIVEYKQPDVAITQEVFDQIARYNSVLRVKYLIVSNGLSHYCGMMDYEHQRFEYLSEIPDYKIIIDKL